MASFDNLVNSLANNSSASTPSPANTGTPIQGPLIDDLTRAQLANMNMTNQQAVNAVQQAQDMQRHIGMDNHVQDYAFVVGGLSILLIMIFLKKVIGKK